MFGALLGALTSTISPLITDGPSSSEAWLTLASTYANPSRGHIKKLQNCLRHSSKSSVQTITEYMQQIKTIADELALLGKPVDIEDITDIILNGLDQTDYKPVITGVQARDTPISFSELHEKLINQELTVSRHEKSNNLYTLATAFVARSSSTSKNGYRNSPGILPTPTTNSRPFLGTYQWCRPKGHYLSSCPSFKQMFPHVKFPNPPHAPSATATPKPTANAAHLVTPSNTWLLDSGASHHITNDLNNFIPSHPL